MAARTKKGRRPTGHDAVATIRLSSEVRESVDAWAAKQSDKLARPEAILRLVELGLETTHRRESLTNRAAKASEMAAQEIDLLVIRQQPTKNANFASGGLSKDRRSSETSARNRVKIEASGENDRRSLSASKQCLQGQACRHGRKRSGRRLDVLIEPDAGAGLGHDRCERGLADLKRISDEHLLFPEL